MATDSSDGVCARCALARALQDPPLSGGASALGGYELRHELGRGAMGVVWLARDRSLDRLVALKVIAANDDPALPQRLLREGQAVARLSHPNIVAIHALGGSGADTFLAMDFAEGGNLTERVNGEPLAANVAATVVAKLAGAVAHAHAAGILHRDIKPSNVLLSASGEPQLADFGLAGAVEGRGDLTRTGQVIGTPAYLAPELLASADAATPAADVYALGAVLYYCLTARAPFVGNSTAALLHQVAEADPVSPRLLQPGVPRDLETICLKCLSKSPAARYASATELRDDLERFLRDEPIAARPLGRGGRAMRWSRRHPNKAAGLALAATLVLLLAVGGPLVALRLERARRIATEAAAEAKAINEFLRNDLVGQASSISLFLPDLKLMTALDRAAPQIDRRFTDQPAIRAALHEQIGTAYLSLGVFPTARAHLAQAYKLQLQLRGFDDPETQRVRGRLVAVYNWIPSYAVMERAARDTWERQKRLLGPEHPDTLFAQGLLASALRLVGRYADSEAVLSALLPVRRRISGPEAWDTLGVLNELGIAYAEEGKYREAEAVVRPALDAFRRNFGPDNLGTLRTANLLAVIYTRNGRLEEAAAIGRDVVERYQKTFGSDNPQTLQVLNNLASTLGYLGEFEEAGALFTRALEARLRVSGPDNPDTLAARINLANILRSLSRFDEAESQVKIAIDRFAQTLGPNHPYTLIGRYVLGTIYKFGHRPAEAEPIVRQVVADRQKVLGPTHTETLLAESELGDVLLREKRFADAEAPLRETVELGAKSSWEPWKLGLTRSRLGEALLSQGKLAEAEPLLVDGERALRENRAKMPFHLRFEADEARSRLARLYTALGKPAEAAKWSGP